MEHVVRALPKMIGEFDPFCPQVSLTMFTSARVDSIDCGCKFDR